MAKYIPIGKPINRAEENGMRSLRDLLPDHYILLGSFDLKLEGRSNSLEFDVVVIGEHNIFAVEIKGWSGSIHSLKNRWKLEWGETTNPFINLEKKAKALRSFLGKAVADYPDAPVESVVLLPRAPQLEGSFPRRSDIVCGLTEILDRFASEDKIYELGPGPFLDKSLRERVVEALVPLAKPSSDLKVVSDYEIIAEIEKENTPYREFVASHKLLRSRKRVRIKRYALDPLSTIQTRQRSFEHLLRDMEAITELEENPYVARGYDVIRDQNDELNFYLVGEWVGSRTLESISCTKEAIYFGEEREVSLLRFTKHLLRAVDYMHKKGIVHRNLNAAVIYVTKDKELPLKIADFEYARIEHLPTIIGETKFFGGACHAPELWLSDIHDHRVDIYACGCILFLLYTGNHFCESFSDVSDIDLLWNEKSSSIGNEVVREIIGLCLRKDPNDRPTISSLLATL